MNDIWNQLLIAGRVTPDASVDDLLHGYLNLLLEMNERMNLTRITERPAAEIHHVADALTLLKYIPDGSLELADVGSGGGVPGLPLAIVRPDINVTLIESTKKKAVFLQSTASRLGLANVRVIDQRAELVAWTDRRESFDVVTARAVGTLDWLAEWCLPLTKVGGKFLAMKGARITEVLPAAAKVIHILGGHTPTVHPVVLPGTEHHVIVEVIKSRKTDSRYPRDPTSTKGKPIG